MDVRPYATEPLSSEHDRSRFSSGSEPLDRYLKQQASQDARRNVAQVFVRRAVDSPHVVGYYTLSMTAVELGDLPENLRRRLPRYPAVPAGLLGRLAINRDHQGTGLGRILLYDAMRRFYEASREVAAFSLIVDAKDASAAAFYTRHGFVPLARVETRLLLPTATIAALFPWV